MLVFMLVLVLLLMLVLVRQPSNFYCIFQRILGCLGRGRPLVDLVHAAQHARRLRGAGTRIT